MQPEFVAQQHWFPEEARDYLATALEWVELLETPEDLRVEVFKAAVQMLSMRSLIPVQPGSKAGIALPDHG